MSRNDHSSDDHEVKKTAEARQGEVSKGTPVRWVLLISTIGAALALLIIYVVFVAAA